MDCDDIDECEEGTHECTESNRKCINQVGKYYCGSCVDGYTYLDGKCTDIDECQFVCVNPDDDTEICNRCPKGAICTNNVGSYECTGLWISKRFVGIPDSERSPIRSGYFFIGPLFFLWS